MSMQLGDALLLGVVQGVTEFLPVSSDGHLVLAEHLLKAIPKQRGPVMELVAHLGTLVPVIILLRKELLALGRFGLFTLWPACRRDGLRAVWNDPTEGRPFLTLLIATAVTGAIGIVFLPLFHEAFRSITVAGIGFLATGTVLALSPLSSRVKETRLWPGVAGAAIIGLAQGLAILPGVSRSALTITSALFLGLQREKAFEFSFIILIPAAIGGALVEFFTQGGAQSVEMAPAAILFLASMITGIFALGLLRVVVRRRRLGLFALYCIPLGIWVLCHNW